MLETILFLVFLISSMLLVIKSADYAIHYSTKVARGFLLPQYVIGFLIVAVIAILPETLISVSSALEGMPSFGLGTLFGSNVADLTLVFALVTLISGRDLKVTSRIISNRFFYACVMASPIIFGLNGHYSRVEGVILIVIGLLFYLFVLKKSGATAEAVREKFSLRDVALLGTSMATLLLGAHLTVKFSVSFAESLSVNPIIIGMFIVGLGTTLPELFFSLRAAKHNHDSLALGDILGTVMADATIVVGTIAVISPFTFNPKIVYVTGMSMVLSLLLLLYFMKSGRALTKKEALLLLLFYLLFVSAELYMNAL